nr:nucleotide pyrophosphohydrolase [Anaerolineae bacterium]
MSDHDTTLADLRQRVAEFVAARDWEQFHVPKNLSIAIAVEAAELLEHFQWLTNEQAVAAVQDETKRAAVADELADVLIYGPMANAPDVDVSTVVLGKLERNEQRFPAEEWRGSARGVGDARSRTAG